MRAFGASVRALADDLGLQFNPDVARYPDLDRDRAAALSYARDTAHDLARFLSEFNACTDVRTDRHFGRTAEDAERLADMLSHAPDLAFLYIGIDGRDLDRTLAKINARGHDTYALGCLAQHACDRAQLLVRQLAEVHHLARVEFRRRRAAQVGSTAAGLLSVAARLLPTADRPRYAEEYACELYELARSGGGRWRQLRYALSQVRSAPRMRFALRSPRRRSVAR
jgi:hypothetical protein